MISLVVDTFEPAEVKEEVKASIPISVVTLAKTGFCDYLWTGYDGHLITAERKEVHDLAGRVDDLEVQLKNAIKAVGDKGEVILIVEGLMIPVGNATMLYKQKRDGTIFFQDRIANRPYAYYMSFIYALDKLGVSTYWTGSMQGTASALVSFVKESNKPEFTTFNRYIKAKPKMAVLNPQVEGLMNLCHGIGASRAQALIKQFGTVWGVLSADESELVQVDGIGKVIAKKIAQDIGKEAQ